MKKDGDFSRKALFFLSGILGLFFLTMYLFDEKKLPTLDEYIDKDQENLISIETPNGTIYSSVATSSIDQEKGLGGKIFLPSDQGMIFVFTEPGIRSFWMKDMIIPLDMVWIDKDKNVVGVTPNVQPDSYPEIFLSPKSVQYVLELNSGAAENFNLSTGTPLQFVI